MSLDRSPARAEALLPLRPVDFHILLLLAEEDLHGYGLVKGIEAASHGRVRLEPGNLYRHVRRLVGQELVAPAGRRAASHTHREERRRYYRITELGRTVLAAEASRMKSLAAAAEAVGKARTTG